MTTCTICSIPTEADVCPWCANTNLADAEGHALPQPLDQVQGRLWWIDARAPLAPKRDGLRTRDGGRLAEEREPFGRLAGIGSTLLGWLCLGYAFAHFFVWTLPKCAWLHTTGRLPLTDTRSWTHTNKEDTR
jgi:hypothetical protein